MVIQLEYLTFDDESLLLLQFGIEVFPVVFVAVLVVPLYSYVVLLQMSLFENEYV